MNSPGRTLRLMMSWDYQNVNAINAIPRLERLLDDILYHVGGMHHVSTSTGPRLWTRHE